MVSRPRHYARVGICFGNTRSRSQRHVTPANSPRRSRVIRARRSGPCFSSSPVGSTVAGHGRHTRPRRYARGRRAISHRPMDTSSTGGVGRQRPGRSLVRGTRWCCSPRRSRVIRTGRSRPCFCRNPVGSPVAGRAAMHSAAWMTREARAYPSSSRVNAARPKGVPDVLSSRLCYT